MKTSNECPNYILMAQSCGTTRLAWSLVEDTAHSFPELSAISALSHVAGGLRTHGREKLQIRL